MTPKEIKNECEKQYQKIKDAEKRIEELRSICKHKNTFTGNYSWREGSVIPAIICDDCGEMVRYLGVLLK